VAGILSTIEYPATQPFFNGNLYQQKPLSKMKRKELSKQHMNALNKYCTIALCFMFACALSFLRSVGTEEAPNNNNLEIYLNTWFILFLLLAAAYTTGLFLVNYLRPASK
jgi:hypothetical protein